MRERALPEAGVEGQRSLLPGRAQGETRGAADISPPWGKWPDGLLVLPQGSKKDRAEGGATTGWMVCGCVSERVSGRGQRPGSGRAPEEATGGRHLWAVQVLAGRRGRHPGGRGNPCKASGS